MLPNQSQRVIAHVDLDAFYTQVEVQRNPELKGLPVVTVQYNPFGDLRTITADEPRIFNDSNGSLIAVSYEARSSGVKRGMRGDQARKVCPEVQLVQVPTAHGKADLTLYRDAGKQVVDVLSRIGIVERASIDECYLDLTQEAHSRLAACSGQPRLPVNADRVHICGQEGEEAVTEWWKRSPEQWHSGELLLACGATAVADLRAAVAAELDYSCSAGIAHNKILAKLASGMHKPSQQTLVPMAAIPGLLQDLPIPKLRQLGGKFGDELMAAFHIKTVGELAGVPLQALGSRFGDSTAQWLYTLALGCDTEEVKQRTLPKSISCGKTFRNHTALHTIDEVRHWLGELAQELEERVAEDRKANARLPQLLTVSFYTPPEGQGSMPGQGKGQAGNGPGQGRGQAGNGPGQGRGQEYWQGGTSISRSCHLRKATAGCMADDATLLVKKWTATQKHWSIWSMFMAVSNFAAAPTGGSLITKFFKQPSSTAQAHQQQCTSAQQDQLLPCDQGVPEMPLGDGQHATALVTHDHPSALDEGAEVGNAAVLVESNLQAELPDTAAHQEQDKGGKPVVAGPAGAKSSPAAPGLQVDAPGKTAFRAAKHLSAVGSGFDAGQKQARALTQTEPAALLQTDAGCETPQACSVQEGDLVQHLPSCPPPAIPDADQDNHQRVTTQGNRTAVAAPREDPTGISDQLVQAQAAQDDSFGSSIQAHEPVRQPYAKRPAAQAFTREPEHRKKPTRARDSGVDAPLFVNYAEDNIDEEVLSKLPASMQREIRLSMLSQRPVSKHRQHSSAQKGSSKADMRKFLKPRS